MPRVPYPTDLCDAEWAILEPLLPPSKSLGRPRADLRAVLNAIRYVTRSGAQWRMVPRDLVPWGTAWSYFRRWRDDGIWQQLHDRLRTEVRRAAGRDPQLSAAILDSQSVKTVERGGAERGFAAFKTRRPLSSPPALVLQSHNRDQAAQPAPPGATTSGGAYPAA